jgi:hypothetical protein
MRACCFACSSFGLSGLGVYFFRCMCFFCFRMERLLIGVKQSPYRSARTRAAEALFGRIWGS